MNFKLSNPIISLKGNSRSARAKRQIIYSFFIQGLSILIGLLYVPLLLNYLTQEKYGIWLTLTSILGWFSFFDIGLGNGLRNKLTESFANGNLALGRKYISTTYAILICIFSLVLVFFHIGNFFLNWNWILNIKTIESSELYALTSIVFTFFIIRFIVQIISVVYLADQKPSATKLITTSGNLISFLIVLVLTRITINGNLLLLGTIISAIPVLLFIVISISAFNTRYKQIKPSIKEIDLKLSNGLINLGAKFFFLQVTYVIVFSTSNVFITQFYGPAEVAVFNIAFKYFHVPILIFSTIMSPIWSAVTDAYAKSDYIWLKKTLRYLNIVSILIMLIVIVMVVISKWVYKMWVGGDIHIPLDLSISLGILTIIQLAIIPYSNFINGIGKLKLSVILNNVGIITYLSLVFVFGNIFKNSTGIVLAIILTRIIWGATQTIQTHKLLNKTAKGIWDK